jgi:hypothetical protein
MSTGSDRGGEDRGNEPPLATVWRLHEGDEEDSCATTEEWYENERLSGHITGGAPRAITPTERSAPAQEGAPAVLDWRFAQATPPPTARQRLGQALGRRFSRRGRALESGSEEPRERPAQAVAAGDDGRTQARQPAPRAPLVRRSDEASRPGEGDRDPVQDRDAETDVEEQRSRQNVSPRPGGAAADAEPTSSLRDDTTVCRPGHAPRRRAAVLALCLAVVATAVAAPILLFGHSAHHTSASSADVRSASRMNPLLSTPSPTRRVAAAPRKAKVTRTPQRRSKRKLQRARHHTPEDRRAHSATHSTSKVAHAPIHTTSTHTTPVYTAPTPTTPASTSTPPTGGSSSSPSTTSSSGSSSGSGTHPSSTAKQPAFGATGTLAPGSSPDG